MTIGFAAEQHMAELNKKDILSLIIITSILEKMFERSLNESSFLEAAGCMNSESILSKPKVNLLQQMESLLHYVLSCLHITSNDCDAAFTQFSKLLEESSSLLLPAFKQFQP